MTDDKRLKSKVKCTLVTWIATLFTAAETWERPTCPSTGEWIKTTWYAYTMDYYSATRKNGRMPFAATWMDPEIVLLSEISQAEEDMHNIISLLHGNLTNDTQELTYKTDSPM